MRNRWQGLIACGVALCLAAPGEARDRKQTAPAHNPALTGLGRLKPVRPLPLTGTPPRIAFADGSLFREDGTPGNPRAVVGAMPVAGPLAAEVGLFSVAGASPKEREFKHGDPVTDIQPRRSRVAAVGLRMRF